MVTDGAIRNNVTIIYESLGMPGTPTSSRYARTPRDEIDMAMGSFLTGDQVNPKYLSVNWESGGGGAFAVIPLEERGKLPERIPLFRGHTAVVLDTDW